MPTEGSDGELRAGHRDQNVVHELQVAALHDQLPVHRVRRARARVRDDHVPRRVLRQTGKPGKPSRRSAPRRASCRSCRATAPSRSTSRLGLIGETGKPTQPIVFREGVSEGKHLDAVLEGLHRLDGLVALHVAAAVDLCGDAVSTFLPSVVSTLSPSFSMRTLEGNV